MNRSGRIISLERSLAAHRLTPRLRSILVFGVFYGFGLFIALFYKKKKVHKGKKRTLNLTDASLMSPTWRPYLAFICLSSFCLSVSLSSLERTGPLGKDLRSHFHSTVVFSPHIGPLFTLLPHLASPLSCACWGEPSPVPAHSRRRYQSPSGCGRTEQSLPSSPRRRASAHVAHTWF